MLQLAFAHPIHRGPVLHARYDARCRDVDRPRFNDIPQLAQSHSSLPARLYSFPPLAASSEHSPLLSSPAVHPKVCRGIFLRRPQTSSNFLHDLPREAHARRYYVSFSLCQLAPKLLDDHFLQSDGPSHYRPLHFFFLLPLSADRVVIQIVVQYDSWCVLGVSVESLDGVHLCERGSESTPRHYSSPWEQFVTHKPSHSNPPLPPVRVNGHTGYGHRESHSFTAPQQFLMVDVLVILP